MFRPAFIVVIKKRAITKYSGRFVMRKTIALFAALLMIVAMFAGCAAPATTKTESNSNSDYSDEVYVWACQFNSLPLFVNNDYIGMDLISEELGVTVKKIGPQEIDLPAMIAAIEQEIANKPNGMMIVGWDASLASVVDEVMDAGIPVVTVDADILNCKRIAFIGSDWYQQGVKQATAAAGYLTGKSGKAVICGMPGADNTTQALNGYTATMAKLCPDIEVVQEVYNSEDNAQTVATTVANLIQADPTIVAVAGTDSTSGPGIGQAITEAGKIDSIIGTCVDAEAEHLAYVKSGALKAAVGQKRIFFTYYGVRMLFDYNHNNVAFTEDDAGMSITPIPEIVSTGFIVATPDNVDIMLETLADKAK